MVLAEAQLKKAALHGLNCKSESPSPTDVELQIIESEKYAAAEVLVCRAHWDGI